VSDQVDPIVEGLEVDGKLERSYWSFKTYARVTIKVYGSAGVSYIHLSSKQESKSIEIDPTDVNDDGLIKKTVDLNTDVGDWSSGWDLDISVADESGNLFKKTKGINGVLDSIYDTLTKVANYFKDFGDWIWDKVTGAASKAPDRATELANSLFNHVKNKTISGFKNLLDPIVSGLKKYVRGLGLTVKQTVNGEAKPKDVRSVMLGPLSDLTSVLDVIKEVTNIVKAFNGRYRLPPPGYN